MLSLPEKYKKDANISKVTFVRGGSLTGADRQRFETSVKDIHITYQIEGFDIPNLVNEDYNCQVIMFLRITLTELKQAPYVSSIVQKYTSPLCVIEFTDGTEEQYSFADKRLNKQNKKEIVIENEYMSSKLPLEFQNDTKTLFALYIDYETILNRSNKHAFYIEMMTKAFLVSNQGLFSGENKLLDNKKLWYDEEKAKQLFPLLRQLKFVKISAAKAKTVSEKSKFNSQIKSVIQQLEELQ
ncbi:MAG: DUF4391 domain-containing protein [Clostridia bacterium]|nr:DUF4391 domain-containing protein [Clostridia bacterium]